MWSMGKGRKRGREHEDLSEQGDVTRTVLKLMDSRLSNFLNRSREQERARLVELFWVFLLRDKAKPKLSLHYVVNSYDFMIFGKLTGKRPILKRAIARL
jgi:hypothetical protein